MFRCCNILRFERVLYWFYWKKIDNNLQNRNNHFGFVIYTGVKKMRLHCYKEKSYNQGARAFTSVS